MGRESLSIQGELDLGGTKTNHDSHLDASTIDRTGVTDIVDESDQGDRDPLAPWRELTGYHGDINPRKPSAMRDLWCAIIERAGSFDRTADRMQFMFRAAGPVIDALVEAHRDEYTEEDGRLDPHTIRLDVMGRFLQSLVQARRQQRLDNGSRTALNILKDLVPIRSLKEFHTQQSER